MLCHFDFHPDNIIIRDGKAIILDWMTACIGDGLSDIARASVILKYSDVPINSKLLKILIRDIKQRVYNKYIEEYTLISKTQIKEIGIWVLLTKAN